MGNFPSNVRIASSTALTTTLPPELVLEIVDRCDPATLIACAAACRLLRRHVLSPAFIQRRRARPHRPSSLLGLFYRHYEGERAPRPPPFTPASDAASTISVKTPFAPDVFDRYTPVESRGGLLVLRRSALFAERAALCVYDSLTGRRAFLPPPEVHQQSYGLLLLGNEGGAGGCAGRFGLRFNHTVQAQSFLPDDGEWGPACEVVRPSPVILGAGGEVLHWLCTDNRTVLTFHAGTGEVGTVLLPPYHVLFPHYYCCGPKQQLLASSPDGELSLLVAQGLVINVWVLRAGQWTRRAAVDVERFVPVIQPALTVPTWILRSMMQLEWAGERSGAVAAQVAGVVLVLDLEAEEVVCTVQRSSRGMEAVVPFRYCTYERDLLARLPAMAPL
ncbi:hypothetical protein SETIT_9G301200v2 [Setaria italica]|uniref:F-box domain-containing protein n=1 Tax=Setaria italica TaxID=4555 RepID=A0A368SM81_SETIT|nr:hypothetical protein SETIT_9G301200v2 [Setaria italica]